MSLLHEIRATAIKADEDITVLLRQCKVLAAKLGNEQFKQWLDWELNGYTSIESLPPYRILAVHSRGNFVGHFQSQMRNVILPPSCLPSEHRHIADTAHLVESISVYTTLLKSKPDGHITIPWPADAVLAFGRDFFENMVCMGAWREVSRGAIAAIVDTVRNRILDFVLNIEAENPSAGEAPINSHPVPDEKLRPLVINTFYGSVGSVAQNSEHFNQSIKNEISPADLSTFVEEVSAHLHELNLEKFQRQKAEAQIAVLKAELDGRPDPTLIRQAGRTLRNITEGAIGSLLAAGVQPSLWHWVHEMLSRF